MVRATLGIRQTKHTIYDFEADKIVKEWIEVPDEK